ncbi:MAG TPA: MBL fold metallo-hydrolase [Candidatus Limnocylindrales bacterium]|nr:MBL fold metallo-hydrolase [Candidatus Limnocylindrales bacterium]
MSENIRITVLVENSVHRQGLVAEHGLSFHVQCGGRSLLFDTGQTDLAVINAETLRLPLDRLEAIVLSHGHYDHMGGVPAMLDVVPEARVYLHPAAFEKKYSQSLTGQSRSIGISDCVSQAIRHHAGGFIEAPGRTEIIEGVFATGEIPRTNNYEDTGGAFFLDAEGTRPDPLIDDQALVIDLGRSVILLLGCAHSGVVNTLNHVQQLTGGKPVCAVIGGLHLGSASEERLQQTIARLRAANLDRLAPAHCTGWPATARLWQAFPNTCRPAGVGTVFEFKRD